MADDKSCTDSSWKDEVEVIALNPQYDSESGEKATKTFLNKAEQETVFVIDSPGKVSRETYVVESPSKSSRGTYNVDSPTKLSRETYNIESPEKLSSASVSFKKSGQATPQSTGDEILQIENEEIKTVTTVFTKHEGKKDMKDLLSVSSRRQSVDNLSVDSGRSITSQSQSDTRSYRERLKDRIKSVKERTGTSAGSSAQSKLWQQRLKQKSPAISKFDDYFRKEEEEINAALEKHQQVRVTWQQAENISSEAEAAFEFFTKIWEYEDEDAPTGPKKASPPDEIESEEQTKLLASQFLGLPDEGQPVVDNYVPPILEDAKKRRELEEQLLFSPTNDSVPLEDKLDGGKIARRLEEEGLFVGNPPKVPARWKNRLEQRILVAGEKHWFGEDGQLKCLSDPLLDKAFHPPMFNSKLNSSLKPVYKPAELMDMVQKDHSRDEVPEDQTCLLELEIGELKFTHHPLFSREHVLSQQLFTLYSAYRDRLESEVSIRLAQHLQALRHARDNLLCIIDTDPSLTEKLNKYKLEICQTKELRLIEGIKDRELTASVLKTWQDLKKLRQQQGFSSTSVHLKIFSPESGETSFCLPNEWENEIENHLKEYKMENKEDIHKTKDEKEKSNIKEKIMDDGHDDLPKLRLQLIETISRSIRPPDEPAVVLQLTENGCNSEVKDSMEIQRRAAMKRCQVSLRVLYNGQEVCQTMSKQIDENFMVRFNQHFAIRILHWPKSLSVEVLSDGKKSMAQVFIPIPSSTTSLDTSQTELLEFSSARNIRPVLGAGAVGSGVPFSIFPGGPELCLHTGGIFTCKTGWGLEDESILSPPENFIPSAKKRNNLPSIFAALKEAGKLEEWADKVQLDPNDPSNAAFFESLQEAASAEQSNEHEEFCLNPLQAEFEFCTDEELEHNPRLKLLRLRDQGAPEFRGLRNIPIREREIPPDIFKIYEKRISASSKFTVPHTVGESSLETHRLWGQQFLSRVRDNLVRRCRQAQHQRALRDIVIEDQVPDMGTLGLTFMKWFQPKRPLRPTRKERTKIPVKSLGGQEVKIIVNVVRAFEVPIRADVDAMSLENGVAMVPVRPFIEISFQDFRCRTTTAEGANPTWNQDLHIPLRAPHGDMTPGGLQAIKDNLYFHLYDETVIDLLEDDRQRATNIHQRLERHWLGSLAIPFASLYANSRVEGTFKLYSPPVLLGYERDEHQRNSSSGASTAPNSSHLRNNTFLTLFITVHPPLHLPEPFKEKLECSESPQLEQHMEEWEAQISREFPDRSVKTMVMDVSGKSICVTRFFRPLDPPTIEDDIVTTPEMAAWFVSKIPLTPGSVLFPGLFDVWLTADQVLKVLQGDCDDHGVLLCCFFLRLGLKAWLVLGIGIPHGRSSFVLTQQDDEMLIWDPTSGQKYSLNDSFCPLHKVHSLINDENVWLNIQKDDALRRVKFDLTRRSDWWGMFGRGTTLTATGSLQPAQLDLYPTSLTDTRLLQERIEKLLRDSIKKWRPTTRTVWNRYCIVTLRKLLPTLEKLSWQCEKSSVILNEHLKELSHILSSHKMCGFPLNFAYTRIEDIEEAVKGTGVHCYENPDAEFALAVYIHPYPCDILSVWVYVAYLVKRR